MIVLDASVLANAIADDGVFGAAARGEMRRADGMAAPDLVDVETLSVLRRLWLRGTLSEDRFRDALSDLQMVDMSRFPAAPLVGRAFELRDNITPYDAMYVALAERLDCTLVTVDRRMASAPGPRCAIHVVQS